jgi:hypothetical protein
MEDPGKIKKKKEGKLTDNELDNSGIMKRKHGGGSKHARKFLQKKMEEKLKNADDVFLCRICVVCGCHTYNLWGCG